MDKTSVRTRSISLLHFNTQMGDPQNAYIVNTGQDRVVICQTRPWPASFHALIPFEWPQGGPHRAFCAAEIRARVSDALDSHDMAPFKIFLSSSMYTLAASRVAVVNKTIKEQSM